MRQLETLHDLSELLGLCEFDLRRLIFHSHEYYRQFRRRKKSGGFRTITAPARVLKEVQRAIVEQLLRELPLPDACTGFRQGFSILHNALPHAGKRFVFNTDIESFFPSITAERVIGLFSSLGYPRRIALALARLTTFNNVLPQGAPTSPFIANLICRQLDRRLGGFCSSKEWKYTRYCDDITISGNDLFSLKDVHAVRRIISSEGFEVNASKTRLRRRNASQVVTGLVVNEHPNISRQQRRVLRAAFHQAMHNPQKYASERKTLEGKVALCKMLKHSASEIEKYEDVLRRLNQQ